ncbi:MAG: hypothetical protein MK033_06205 [Candidatus Caenarcaniphilales bacterium]|nr:hypothetical protein [Candidatus Caenarcaniphilales bacterium]
MLKGKKKKKHKAFNRYSVKAQKDKAAKISLDEFRNALHNLEEINETSNDSFDRGQLLAKLEALYLRGVTKKSELARILGVSYTVVQRLYKQMQGRLYYQSRLEDKDSMHLTGELIGTYLLRCNDLIKRLYRTSDAMEEQLFIRGESRFKTNLSNSEKISYVRTLCQNSKYLHDIFLSINAIYGITDNVLKFKLPDQAQLWHQKFDPKAENTRKFLYDIGIELERMLDKVDEIRREASL